MHVWNGSLKTQDAKIAKNSLSGHHRTTLSGHIFATKARINNRKNLLNSNASPTCPHNMVNFGPLAAETCWRVWGTPGTFQRVSRLGRLNTAWHFSSGRQPNFAALNRGRHLYSAGRPSGWALAHISSFYQKFTSVHDIMIPHAHHQWESVDWDKQRRTSSYFRYIFSTISLPYWLKMMIMVTRHRASTSTRWHFAFGAIRVYSVYKTISLQRAFCHSNEIRAPIGNPPNSASLEGTAYHSSKLHPGPCAVVLATWCSG